MRSWWGLAHVRSPAWARCWSVARLLLKSTRSRQARGLRRPRTLRLACPTPSSKGSTAQARTAVRFSLPKSYQPRAALCEPTEAALPRPPGAVNLLRACRPRRSPPWYVRLVNVSDTTLGYEVGRGLAVTTAPPPQEG